jgi:hypothetical protein
MIESPRSDQKPDAPAAMIVFLIIFARIKEFFAAFNEGHHG